MSSSDPLAHLRQQLEELWLRQRADLKRSFLDGIRHRGSELLEQLVREMEALPEPDLPLEEALESLREATQGSGGLEGLFLAARAMDRARHQGAVLEILMQGALRFADRATVLLTRKNGVEIWGSTGFQEGNLDALAGRRLPSHRRALERLLSGRGVVRLEPEELSDLAPEWGAAVPAQGVLVPLVLRDHVAAALYADRVEAKPQLELQGLQLLVLLAQQRLELQALSERFETPTLWLEEEASLPGLPLWDPERVVVPQPAASGASGVAPDLVETTPVAAEAVREEVFEQEPVSPPLEQPAEVLEVGLGPGVQEVLEPELELEPLPALESEEATGSWYEVPSVSYESAPSLEGVFEQQAGVEGAAASFEGRTASVPTLEEPAAGLSVASEPAVEFIEKEPAQAQWEVTAPLETKSLELGSEPGVVEELPGSTVLEQQEVAELKFEEPAREALWTKETPAQTLDLPPIGPLPETPASSPPPPLGLETRALSLGQLSQGTPPATGVPTAPPGDEDATVLIRRPQAAPAPDLSEDATVWVRQPPREPEPRRFAPPPPPVVPRPEPPKPTAAEAAEATGGASMLDQTQSRRSATEVVPPPDIEGPGLAFRPGAFERRTLGDPLHEEARRLARLLISEIKLYNEEQVEEGRRNKDLYHRLREDIDRSRQIYEERVHESVKATVDYFQQELIRSLAGGDPRALGI